MKEVTSVLTIELTQIEHMEEQPAPMPEEIKRELARLLEDLTGCDHVQVVKVQDFILEA